jgi:hypothetical protein
VTVFLGVSKSGHHAPVLNLSSKIKKLFIRKYGAMVQHWIIMQKVASSSPLGYTFAMNREYFSYIIGKSLSV